MTLRTLLHDLLPPLLVRWLRPRKATESVAPTVPKVHVVRAGPLRDARLLVNDAQPAFREMIDGSYDDYLWSAMPAELEGGLLLDIGAHIGYHALGLAAKYPASRVIAFEPNPANLDRLRRNLDLNPSIAARIEVEEVALSDINGRLTFRASANIDDQTSSGGYLERGSPPLDVTVYARAGFGATEVAAVRLDDRARTHGWGPVRAMKIDVEGAEHLVLAGALDTLRKDHPLLFMEIHSVVCMLKVLDLLHPLGYRVRLLHEDRPSRCFIAAV